jgi:hypothetical protein
LSLSKEDGRVRTIEECGSNACDGGRHAGLPMQGLRTPHDARCEIWVWETSACGERRGMFVSVARMKVKHAGDSR